MKAAITSIAYTLGEKILAGGELARRFGAEAMRKIEKFSGILERRVAGGGVCASDLGVRAAELIFKNSKIERNDIDLLIFSTQMPDYIMPSNACLAQDRLGLPKTCAAFDINLGCSQFPYALATAGAWIESGAAKTALVILADTVSRLIHPLDKSAVTIFGDAAAAFVVEKCAADSLASFDFGSDGAGAGNLICPASGARKPRSPEDDVEITDSDGNTRTNANMYINGFGIFAFAYKSVPETVNRLLKKNSLSVGDIDLFVFHQAGEMMVSSAAKRLKIPPEKVYYKMHDIGNCGGASIPIALADAAARGRLKPGMRVLVCAFGVGLSLGAAIIEWSPNFLGAYTDADFSHSPFKPPTQLPADAQG